MFHDKIRNRQFLKVCLRTVIITALFMSIFWTTPSRMIFSQPSPKPFEIHLKSRIFLPTPGFTKLSYTQKQHLIIQFTKLPSRVQRLRLQAKGISLLSYLGGNAYYAAVEQPQILNDTETVKRDSALSAIRWLGPIGTGDRVETKLLSRKFDNWAVNKNGTVKIRVMFFADLSQTDQTKILNRFSGQIQKHSQNTWQVTIDPAKIPQLITEDGVHWVEQEPSLDLLNDVTRNEIGVDTVQNFNTTTGVYGGFSGNGVTVMVRDTGIKHSDFTGRLLATNAPNATENHGTHVAGIIGASGAQSNQNNADGTSNGGTAYQWRGMAPNAKLVGYIGGWDTATYSSAVTTYGAEISNHSHTNGNSSIYGTDAVNVDDFIRDNNFYIVTAAANNGTTAQYGTLKGYYSIIGTVAKNAISVGNYNSVTNIRWQSSSMGPTFDGRIKPDVMAPGRVTSTIYKINDATHDNSYGFKSGTSMASPCTAGVVALMLEAFRHSFGTANPKPFFSTIKSILINTATDMVQAPNMAGEPNCPDFTTNPQPVFYHAGPDWATGYGLINAQQAVNTIQNKSLYLQDSIDDSGDTDEFPVYVPAGSPEIKITLVWDDAPGDPTTANTSAKLVNDLDLELVAPDGTTIHRPWVLNALNPANDGNLNPADITAATTGVDHLNNVEQVQVAAPAAGTWTVRVKCSALPEPVQSYSLASNLAFSGRDLAIVQTIDRTGSMGYYHYLDPAKEKAKLFVDLMQPGEQIGVVSFATIVPPSVNYPLTTIGAAETEKSNAKAAIDSLVSNGNTSIGAGIQLSQGQLNTTIAGAKRVMILLSDGYQNTPPWVADILPTIPSDTKIYTIALGTTVDATLLQDIATATGGEYYNSPTIEDLQKIYLELHGAILGLDSLGLSEGDMTNGGTTEKDLAVDPLTKEATFVVTWLDNRDSLTTALYDPNGKLVNTGSTLKIYTGKTYQIFRIKDPTPGKWRLKVTGTNVASGKANYVMTGFVNSRFRFRVLPHEIKFLTGDRVLVAAKLEVDGQPVQNASVKLNVTRPKYWYGNIIKAPKELGILKPLDNLTIKPDRLTLDTGKVTELEPLSPSMQKLQTIISSSKINILARDSNELMLFDDGQHGDGKAGDGIYANYFTKTEIGGDYHFTINASCSIQGVDTVRERSFSAFSGINIYPKYSTIDVKPTVKSIAGQNYSLKVEPKDQYGNLLGSGHQITVIISGPGIKRSVVLTDNFDGSYSKDFTISPSELKAGVKYQIEVNGGSFTPIQSLPVAPK